MDFEVFKGVFGDAILDEKFEGLLEDHDQDDLTELLCKNNLKVTSDLKERFSKCIKDYSFGMAIGCVDGLAMPVMIVFDQDGDSQGGWELENILKLHDYIYKTNFSKQKTHMYYFDDYHDIRQEDVHDVYGNMLNVLSEREMDALVEESVDHSYVLHHFDPSDFKYQKLNEFPEDLLESEIETLFENSLTFIANKGVLTSWFMGKMSDDYDDHDLKRMLGSLNARGGMGLDDIAELMCDDRETYRYFIEFCSIACATKERALKTIECILLKREINKRCN